MLVTKLASFSAIIIATVAANAALSDAAKNGFRFPFSPLQHKKTQSNAITRRDSSYLLHRLIARADNTTSAGTPVYGYLPTTYIFELDAAPGTSAATKQQADFLAYAKQKLNVQVRQNFNLLFNAVSLDILDDGEWGLNSITNFSGIKSVRPIGGGAKHAPVAHAIGTEAVALRRRQSVESKPDPNAGKDIKVGIIDSGIDYTHPALGGCFGAGCKVAYGWDFVGDAYTGADYPAPGWKPVPDSDPLDTCNGHGTHVAGLVAASSDLVTGNAPAATLGAYRVLSCTGSVAMDIIVSAMERAASDGMDVVNISIGTGKFYTDYADADAAQRLTARGIVVVASAGNDGLGGLTTLSSPGVAPNVITVGSMGRPKLSSFSFKLDSDGTNVYYLSANQTVVPAITFKTIKRVEKNNTDSCAPYGIGYSGKFVVLNRGGCTFTQKALNAQNANALGIIVVNDYDELNFPVVDAPVNIHVLIIGYSQGQNLYKLLPTTSDSTTVKWTQTVTQYDADYNTYQWSEFSSNGPVADITNIKPEVTSFGETVFSTYLTKLGSYAILSGTSMASPQVAGLAAAAIQRLGSTISVTERPEAVRRLLMQTSVAQTSPELEDMTTNKNTYTSPIISAGAGIARLVDSSETNWGLYPLSAGFRGSDSGGSSAAYTFDVTLTGDIPPGTITFKHKPGWGVSSWNNRKHDYYVIDGAVSSFTANPSKITITKASTIKNINTRRTEKTSITIYPPYEADPIYYMVFNGLIEAIHTDAKTGKQTIRHIPYQTTRGAQRVLGPLRRDDNYPRLDYMDANGNLFTSTSKTRLVTAAGDYVAVRFRLDTPSPWAIVAVEDLNGNIIGMAYDAYGGPLDATKDDPNDDTWCYWNGLIQPMPSFNQPGTSIIPVQDGQYKLRLFTYRPYSPDGSLNVRSSYDTWLSPVITVTGIAALYGASAQSQGISTQTTGKSTSVMTKLSVTGADMRIQSGTMQLMYKITQ